MSREVIPAFPFAGEFEGEHTRNRSIGMELRDYFAAKAMQAIITVVDYSTSTSDVANDAYAYAAAMLKARGK